MIKFIIISQNMFSGQGLPGLAWAVRWRRRRQVAPEAKPVALDPGSLEGPDLLPWGSKGFRTCATGFAPFATWPWRGAAAASVLPWPRLARQHILEKDD
jgi:hypothetical protein